jgi:hypothetical protein
VKPYSRQGLIGLVPVRGDNIISDIYPNRHKTNMGLSVCQKHHISASSGLRDLHRERGDSCEDREYGRRLP